MQGEKNNFDNMRVFFRSEHRGGEQARRPKMRTSVTSCRRHFSFIRTYHSVLGAQFQNLLPYYLDWGNVLHTMIHHMSPLWISPHRHPFPQMLAHDAICGHRCHLQPQLPCQVHNRPWHGALASGPTTSAPQRYLSVLSRPPDSSGSAPEVPAGSTPASGSTPTSLASGHKHLHPRGTRWFYPGLRSYPGSILRS